MNTVKAVLNLQAAGIETWGIRRRADGYWRLEWEEEDGLNWMDNEKTEGGFEYRIERLSDIAQFLRMGQVPRSKCRILAKQPDKVKANEKDLENA